jgi:phosphatidylglycerol:prolipoprotein diacylglycerol transferase
MAGLWTASLRGRRYGIPSEVILDMGPWLMVGVIVGARAWYVIAYWDDILADAAYYHNPPFVEAFMVQHAGLVFYGGLIGASLATILYARLKKIKLWRLADALAPSIAFGSAFGRIGCLMNGCCYGKDMIPVHWWAIKFPPGHASASFPVHPTQIYDSLLNLALYGGLAWFYRRKKFDGQVFAIYLMCYAVTRSFVEIYRGDYTPQHLFHGLLTPAQLASIIGVLIGAILLWKLPKPRAIVPGTPVTAGLPGNA